MSSLEALQQVNEKLRNEILRLRPDQRHCSTITPQDFAALLTEILHGAECLRSAPSQSQTTAFTQQTLEYRTNLETLRDFLPELHSNLLAEKSRLETVQTQITAANAWARATTGTL